jgi:hypothetical protein
MRPASRQRILFAVRGVEPSHCHRVEIPPGRKHIRSTAEREQIYSLRKELAQQRNQLAFLDV